MPPSFDASIAWARTHMTFVLDDIASTARAAERIPHYERLMAQYPELAPACQEQIDRIVDPGVPVRAPAYALPATRPLQTLYEPLPHDLDEEDVPF